MKSADGRIAGAVLQSVWWGQPGVNTASELLIYVNRLLGNYPPHAGTQSCR